MNEANTVRLVLVSQPFAIDLEAMPGAGYMWELASHPDEIELVTQEVVSISREIGGNSTQKFILIAHQPGSYSLEFVLKRRWEKNPIKTGKFTIQAK